MFYITERFHIRFYPRRLLRLEIYSALTVRLGTKFSRVQTRCKVQLYGGLTANSLTVVSIGLTIREYYRFTVSKCGRTLLYSTTDFRRLLADRNVWWLSLITGSTVRYSTLLMASRYSTGIRTAT